ncbi:uncharacterized protein LOC109860494 isoform X2 [Pseudomyrmex gracilis]|nr:uncharacterized protein LOC109860494 isoform X2 [Pseudomyrmex gracilis]
MRGSGADWASDLSRDINRMTQDINSQVQSFTRNLHTNVVQPAIEQANRAIENLPKDAQGHIISSGNTMIFNSGNGVTKSVLSGRTPDGEPYVRNIEEYYRGNVLYHNETLYNPKTKTTKKFSWKLDLATPGATPQLIQDE